MDEAFSAFQRNGCGVLKSLQWIFSMQYKTETGSKIEISFLTDIVTKLNIYDPVQVTICRIGRSQLRITSCGACGLSKIRGPLDGILTAIDNVTSRIRKSPFFIFVKLSRV